MPYNPSSYPSWGNFPKATPASTDTIKTRNQTINFDEIETKVLPYGLGRSYGDVCLNDREHLLVNALKRFIDFDQENDLLTLESGISLQEVLDWSLPRGYFLPVTPGTKYVTIAGAIANDVHGKNHHQAGTFGCYVQSLELLRSDGQRLICSRENNPELFQATIGGMGLTGFITWAQIKLKKIHGPMIDMENIKFNNIDDFFKLSEESEQFEYTVSWIDCLATGDSLGRGHFIRGNHSDTLVTQHKSSKPGLGIPIYAPSWVLSSPFVYSFNQLYYNKQKVERKKATVHYNPFFYPLDKINHWNKIYGKRGFLQYQFVIPLKEREALDRIMSLFASSKMGSFLVVMKTFGAIKSPGLMSFPKEGVTIALDFPNYGERLTKLLQQCDEIVANCSGSVYPAKDARMSPEHFKHFYPQWKKFSSWIDPNFSSSFWRRVSQ